MRRWLAEVPYPAQKPPLLALKADRDGALWVQVPTPSGDTRDRWIAFDPDGSALAQIRLPRGARLLEIGRSYALLARSDDLDIERVELRMFERR